jgi:hypothetical protein
MKRKQVELVLTDAAFTRGKQKCYIYEFLPAVFLVFMIKAHCKQGECFGSEEDKIIAVFDCGGKKYVEL